MCEEVLETDRFPEISYECSEISANGSGDRYWLASNGELTLPGVTKPLPVSARAVIAGNTVRATGEFSVRQSEFGNCPCDGCRRGDQASRRSEVYVRHPGPRAGIGAFDHSPSLSPFQVSPQPLAMFGWRMPVRLFRWASMISLWGNLG